MDIPGTRTVYTGKDYTVQNIIQYDAQIVPGTFVYQDTVAADYYISLYSREPRDGVCRGGRYAAPSRVLRCHRPVWVFGPGLNSSTRTRVHAAE